MTEKEFYATITVKKDNRYDLIFFILNTLHLIQKDDYYFYCETVVNEENGVFSKPKLWSGHCQLCKILRIFNDFKDVLNDGKD